MNRKWIVALIGFVLTIGLLTKLALASGILQIQVNLAPFQYSVNGKTFNSTDSFNNGTQNVPTSVNYKGTTYVPIRLLAQTMGLNVEWDDTTDTAYLSNSSAEDDPVSDIPDGDPNKAEYIPNAASIITAGVLLAKPAVN